VKGELEKNNKQLEKSQEKWKYLTENTDDTIIFVDKDNCISYINKAVPPAKLEEVIGTSIFEYVSENYHDVIKNSLKKVYTTGKPDKYEVVFDLRAFNPEFVPCWYSTKVFPLKSDHEINGVILIASDISEQKQVHQHLEIFKNFVQTSSLGHGFSDLDGNIIYINPKLCEMLGLEKPENALGKNVGIYYSDNFKSILLNEVLPKVKKEGSWRGELPLMSVNGEITPTIQNISLIYDEKDNPVYLGNAITDITDSKKAQEALQESEKKYKTLFEYAGDALFILEINSENRVMFMECNQHTFSLFGCENKDIIGQSPALFSPEIQPDGRSSNEKIAELAKLVMEDKPQNFIWLHHRYDNKEPFWVEVNLTRLILGGKSNYMQAVVRDITKRKKAEEILKKASQTLNATQSRYEGGKVDFLSLIDAQRILLNFQLAYYRHNANFYQRLSELQSLLGEIQGEK